MGSTQVGVFDHIRAQMHDAATGEALPAVEPVLREGDRLKISVVLLKQLYDLPGHESPVVVVKKIDRKNENYVDLWLSHDDPPGRDS